MKRNILLTMILLINSVLYAQTETSQEKPGAWYLGPVNDGNFGIDFQKAKELLKDKPVKKTPVVAILCSGIDIEHEALKNSIWINPDEKPDGIDNDNNGYIDDINGWNFIGGKSGAVMDFSMQEGDREWIRLKDKYADFLFDGKKCFKIINGERNYNTQPENIQEYAYFTKLLLSKESSLGRSYAGYKLTFLILEYVKKWDEILLSKFPGKSRNEISKEDFMTTIYDKNTTDSLRDVAITFASIYAGMIKGYGSDKPVVITWEDIYKNYTKKQIDFSKKSFDDQFAKFGNDRRKEIVGDNYLDINDYKYGNNSLLTSVSTLGTMLSGIITGKEVDGTGVTGIAPEAKIMTLVTNTASGEPYLKDIALAVRYAINKGADIILLPQQNTLYPPDQKKWISDALKLAESKGILVIVPVWEKSDDMSVKEYYPNRKMDPDHELTNLMTVASSDIKGLPSLMSNYGKNELDTYAPGLNIYACFPGDIYKTANSASLGVAMTAGIAAMIKTYYPQLTGSQIRNIIIENGTSRKGIELEKGIMVNNRAAQDLFLFEQLCKSGGVVNAYNAIKAAGNIQKGNL